MVKLHIKKGDESQFLYECGADTPVDTLLDDIVPIYNGRLKVQRVCAEVENLAEHGPCMPPNMQGLTDEQVEELKLVDEWAHKCEAQGGHVLNRDPIGRRNGRAPNANMAELLKKTSKEAKDMISKKLVESDLLLSQARVTEALDIVRGAVTIVWPMGLPPHDPVRAEFDNQEDLSGTQASLEVLEPQQAALWWAGKELLRGKKLKDFTGANEKTKIVAKLQKKGGGAPGREPVVTDKEKTAMMQHFYHKQEEFKKLQADAEDGYMDQEWADSGSLRRQFQGLNNISWRPGGGPR